MTDKPDDKPDKSSSEPECRSVVLRAHPKVIFLYPTLLAALLAGFCTLGSMSGGVSLDEVSLTPGRIFWWVFAINPLGIAFDCTRGEFAALVLFWLLKKVVIAPAYSVVGATATLMGFQTLLLGLGVRVLPFLDGTRWAAPAVFGTLVLIGWASQLISRRPQKVAVEVTQAPALQTAAPQTTVASEPVPRPRRRKSLYQQAQLAKKRWGRRRRRPAD